MIGGLTSSLALAQRTASKARVTMDSMSRQIATGQKVASVKDNGAVWAQAAALKSQKAEIDGRATLVSFVRTAVDQQSIEDSAMRESLTWIRDVLVRSLQHNPGTQSRQMLHDELQRAVNSVNGFSAPSAAITTGYALQPDGQYGFLTSSADTVFNGRTMWSSLDSGPNNYMTWLGVNNLNTFNLSTATNAQVQVQLNNTVDVLMNHHHWLPNFEGRAANDQRWLDSVVERDGKTKDRLDTAIGSLTDADLGKVSTQRAQAETRQQLALDTIKTALTAYGNYAGGLLGNVQRTQRGVLA
jgi:flagellin